MFSRPLEPTLPTRIPTAAGRRVSRQSIRELQSPSLPSSPPRPPQPVFLSPQFSLPPTEPVDAEETRARLEELRAAKRRPVTTPPVLPFGLTPEQAQRFEVPVAKSPSRAREKTRLAQELEYVSVLLDETEAYISRLENRQRLWCQPTNFSLQGLGITKNDIYLQYTKMLAGKYQPSEIKQALVVLWKRGCDPRIIFFCIYAKISHDGMQIRHMRNVSEYIQFVVESTWQKDASKTVWFSAKKARMFYTMYLPNLLAEMEEEKKYTNGVDDRPRPLLGNMLIEQIQANQPISEQEFRHGQLAYSVSFLDNVCVMRMAEHESRSGNWILSFRYQDHSSPQTTPKVDDDDDDEENKDKVKDYPFASMLPLQTRAMQMLCWKEGASESIPYFSEHVNPETFPGPAQFKRILRALKPGRAQENVAKSVSENYQQLARYMNYNDLSNDILQTFIKTYSYACLLGPKMEDEKTWSALPLREAAIFFPGAWFTDFFALVIIGEQYIREELKKQEKQIEMIQSVKNMAQEATE